MYFVVKSQLIQKREKDMLSEYLQFETWNVLENHPTAGFKK